MASKIALNQGRSGRILRLQARLQLLVLEIIALLIALLALVPVVLVISASFSTERSLSRQGYRLFPAEWSTTAYSYIFSNLGQIINAYAITIIVTVFGTLASLLVSSLLGYVLSRNDFPLRRGLSFYLFFTMLFSGGLVPWYLLISQYLQLKNNLLVLILPYLVMPFYVLILRTYFAALPEEILDAARVDGAGEWRLFFQIVLPLSTPALATIGLFIMLTYWNDWWLALLFISDQKLFPIQLLLYNMLTNASFVTNNPMAEQMARPPILPVRMAMVVLTTVPVAVIFLWLQKHFVRGLMVGSLRG
jgi:putative aldouronate transport system permease protein